MKIQSIKTGLKQVVSPAQWDKMVTLGISKNFKVLTVGVNTKRRTRPVDLAATSYDSILESASVAYREERFEDALKLYEKAAKITKSAFVDEKVQEITNLLDI